MEDRRKKDKKTGGSDILLLLHVIIKLSIVAYTYKLVEFLPSFPFSERKKGKRKEGGKEGRKDG